MVTSDMARVRELQYNDRFIALSSPVAGYNPHGGYAGARVDPRLSTSMRLELLARHQQQQDSSASDAQHYRFQ